MILEALIGVIMAFASGLLGVLFGMIKIVSPNLNIDPILGIMGYGVYFIGAKTFCLVVSTFVGWGSIHMTWAVIEWIYKKIPGVD